MKQSEQRNLTMVMDLYELTMANGYFNDGDKETRVAFDVFYRKNPDRGGFAIFAGLEQIIEYIENHEKKYIEKKNTDLAIALAKKGYYTKVKPLLEKEYIKL